MKIGIHYQEKQSWQFILLSCFLCLLLFGCYKNGLFYFLEGKMGFIEAISLLSYSFISFIFYLVATFGLNKKITKEGLIISILLGLIIPPRFPLWCYILCLLGFGLWKQLFQPKVSTISSVLVFKMLTIMSSYILKIDYQNMIEVSGSYVYNLLDIFIGHSIGNLGTTSIFLLLILFAILSNNFYYKKDLVGVYLFTFSLLELGYVMFFEHSNLLISLLNSHVLFTGILLVPEKGKSPALKNMQIFYGIILGILTFVFNSLFKLDDGPYIALFCMQIFWTLIFMAQKRKLLT